MPELADFKIEEFLKPWNLCSGHRGKLLTYGRLFVGEVHGFFLLGRQ
jgi:hypothetical protein